MAGILRARSARSVLLVLLLCFTLAAGVAVAGQMNGRSMQHTTTKFSGVKVNAGTAIHIKQGSQNILTLSDDFQVPDTPDPHWQLVDSQGNTYLLDRLKVKGDRTIKSITVPAYVPDVAKVQIYCSWAEALLGEASFAAPVK